MYTAFSHSHSHSHTCNNYMCVSVSVNELAIAPELPDNIISASSGAIV